MKLFTAAIAACLAFQSVALSIGSQSFIVKRGSDTLQDIVTWDEHSLLIYGQRILIYSGEFHPFRLPVPDLWLDIFQKVKALGFSAVSFYTDWALLEGEPGMYRADGIFSLEPFLEAASEVGIYLIARPGPYINAETSGGGFPGWLQRIKGELRTRAPDYLAATANYVSSISKTISRYQITNGGPVILLQPENEYSGGVTPGDPTYFPDPVYFSTLEKQYRDSGILVPFVNNDAWSQGLWAPGSVRNGSTLGDVDIYGHDSYPLGFDCAHPYTWPNTSFPTYFHSDHEEYSPSSPFSLVEFQGGAFDPWGGNGFDKCAILLNQEFERVFYKNNFAQGATILSLYMIYGGTNWGNLGFSGVYTSYDYAASIAENRQITREKYSEAKLEGNFMRVSPDILSATVGDPLTIGNGTSIAAITLNPLYSSVSLAKFYVARHTDATYNLPVTYKLMLPTSKGNISIPQLSGSLTLNGRDSKWHVTDYPIGSATLLYSTAEILTWKMFEDKIVLVVYGGPGERHELAIVTPFRAEVLEGQGVTVKASNDTAIINWETSYTRRVLKVGNIFVYILDRNTAYNYWVLDFKRNDAWQSFTANIGNTTSVIIQAGYLIRKVSIEDSSLHVYGDLNATVPIRIIGAPKVTKKLVFNGQNLPIEIDPITGDWSTSVQYHAPSLKLPELSALNWKYLDDLPEIKPSYDDSKWTKADHRTTNNPTQLATPTSLYSSDYGFHAGALIYRGHFTASSNETTIFLNTTGGAAFGSSVWLDDTYIGSWNGNDITIVHADTYKLPNLKFGHEYVLTVVIDNNGLNEDWYVGGDDMKSPRGILNYTLAGRPQSAITWKVTGNLGGEKYIDKARGPLNEGGLFAERQGYHLPYPPSGSWADRSPFIGSNNAGIALYSTSFDLDLPKGYDVPLAFNFGNTTINGATANYQVQLWVNGFQFGKYINNIGPQTSFPVPQGILDYQGTNWVAVEIWARDRYGAKLINFTLEHEMPIWTAMKAPKTVDAPNWVKRKDAY